jgi:endogenous inhibitor of DNA gyrase (YacG/DUF329 family)
MTPMNDRRPPPDKGRTRRRRCPICGRPVETRWRPFCSPRCADVDLGRWLGEAYRIPAADDDAESEDDGPPAS